MSTQAPLHGVKPAGQMGTQVAFAQVLSAGQAFPQFPQLAGSEVRSAQVDPHGVVPAGQGETHWPDSQVALAEQADPHWPQLAGSAFVSIQTPPQQVRSPQPTPQSPQCVLSVSGS